MATCGMYDFAGEWLYTVGLPAKSGVAGGVIAVLPGQLGIGVFSPRARCARQHGARHRRLPGALAPLPPPPVPAGPALDRRPVRRRCRGDVVRAAPLARARRVAHARPGGRTGSGSTSFAAISSFGAAERLVRTVIDDFDAVDHVVLDFRRVAGVDEVASALLEQLATVAAGRDVRLIASHLQEGRLNVEAVIDTDEALQRCEEDILTQQLGPRDGAAFPLADQPLLTGLSSAEISDLELVMTKLNLAAGDVLCREGDPADDIYFVSSGALRAEVASSDGGPPKRLLTMGPGTALGEIALVDGGPRSATVVADEPSSVRSLAFSALAELGSLHPGLETNLYRNLGRLLAWRLRRATDQIRALER